SLAAGGLALSLMLAGGSFVPPLNGTARADDTKAAAPLDRAAIEAIVHDYLLKNPEVLLEVQAALEKKQGEAQKVAQREAITGSAASIFNAGYDGMVGNPDGKVTIVEFFDYNCHF